MDLYERSRTFLQHVDSFIGGLQPLAWDDVAANPGRTAVFAADMINGFCYSGNLASARIGAIVPPVVQLFEAAHAHGVRQFVMIQEWHSEHAEEFRAFAPHAIRETDEAETVAELAALPFAGEYTILRKNSVSAAANPLLNGWLDEHPLQTAIVAGDCTDICAYMLALHLRTRANERDQRLRVIVPANCIQTYDLPVDSALALGAMPHDGDVLHEIFLYHMALHGIEVVRELR